MIDWIIVLPAVLFAVTIHEFAHGWVASRFGDPTAKQAGRLTLNPISHLDPIGTLMLIFLHFGWAKPVPVNPAYFKNPKKGMLLVALAGPFSNLLISFISGMMIVFIYVSEIVNDPSPAVVMILTILELSLMINIALGIFNLIPVPPLDGSKILWGLLPSKYDYIAYKLERQGPLILLAIVLLGMVTGRSFFWPLISPFVDFFSTIFTFGILG